MPTALDFQPLALDLGVVALILSVFVGDLLLGAKSGKLLGLSAGLSLFVLFCASFQLNLDGRAFGGAYVGSAFSTYLKRLFLLSGGWRCWEASNTFPATTLTARRSFIS